MIVAHNLQAMNTSRQLNIVSGAWGKSTEKLASGYRVNRAADDAAGLAISEKMRHQIRGLDRGALNIEDGVSLCQVADGALAEVSDMLLRLTELSVQSANGTNSDSDRFAIQEETNQIISEINRIGATTKFNDTLLFTGESPGGISSSSGGSRLNLKSMSPAAETGHMTEAFEYNGKYYPSASIDFSKINSSNIKQLDDGEFTFNCTQSCAEQFRMVFTLDNDESVKVDTKRSDGDLHTYTIGIKSCTSGQEIVDRVYSAVSKSPVPGSDELGGKKVSHSNVLIKSTDGNKLIVSSTSPSTSEQAAKDKFAKQSSSKYNPGGMDVSNLVKELAERPVYTLPIHCSSEVSDKEFIATYRMNGAVLGIDPLDVSTEQKATKAIDKVEGAIKIINSQRSEIGASQNRLEHAYNINKNSSENTQAGESRIRDTDMVDEITKNAKLSILSQAGQSMLAQTKQSTQGVLALLQ